MPSEECFKLATDGSAVPSAVSLPFCSVLTLAESAHSLISLHYYAEIFSPRVTTVDMAVPYSDLPDQNSDFASIWDSSCILMNLNKYKMKPVVSMTREADGLLRITIFSKELKLVGTHKTLSQNRLKLAHNLQSTGGRTLRSSFYQHCVYIFNHYACMASTWGEFGGYIDSRQFNEANSAAIEDFWIIDTIMTCAMMGLGMSYIVLEVWTSPIFSS